MSEIDYEKLYKKWHYQILQYPGDAAMSVIPAGFTGFCRDNKTNSTHIHKCYELCFSLEGNAEYICGGRKYNIEPYTIFIADPDVTHEIRLPLGEENGLFTKYYYLVSFGGMSDFTRTSSLEREGAKNTGTVSDANIIANFMLSHENAVYGMKDFIMGHLRRLSEFGESDADYIDIYHETYSFIMGALYRLASSENKAQNCIFETGLEVEPGRNSRVTYETSLRYIATMVYDRVTVADIAEKVHTSVRNLEYLFKRYMNMTVKDYMISVKISSAAALLRMNAKVSETADKLCFEDVSTFTRLFKKHMGVTPKQYQQQCNSDENVFGTVYRETIPPKKSEEKE